MPAGQDRPASSTAMVVARTVDPLLVLSLERSRAVERIEALTRDLDSVVESCESDAYDDEHDPEGHTIAFERQQLAALLRDARSHLAELDHAIGRVSAGTYGTCERCGGAVAPERLESRPAARTCIACAR